MNLTKELGLQGNSKESVSFRHENKLEEVLPLLQVGSHLDRDWKSLGITQLHADGDIGDEMLSVAQVKKGAFEIRVFERGQGIKDIPAIDLFDVLEEDTQQVLTKNMVNTDKLLQRAHTVTGKAGDIIVFNPVHPHMAITLQEPRFREYILP